MLHLPRRDSAWGPSLCGLASMNPFKSGAVPCRLVLGCTQVGQGNHVSCTGGHAPSGTELLGSVVPWGSGV